MKRSPSTYPVVVWDNLRRLVTVFVRQRMPLALVTAGFLLVLAVIFAFLAFAPVLSPFVYPLF